MGKMTIKYIEIIKVKLKAMNQTSERQRIKEAKGNE